MQNGWIIWTPFCFSVLKSWTTQIRRHSLDLIGFCMIQQCFSHILKISLNSRGGDLISWGKPILQNGWTIWSSLLYFSFKKLNYPNSSSFIRFDWILHDSAVLFWYFENFHKFKKGDLIYWGGINYAEWLNYLVLPLYINFKKLNDPNSSSHMRSFWLFRF